MRRIRLFPALLAFLLSSCSENIIQQWPEGGAEEGIVRISLDTDMNNTTKADAEGPDLDAFRVAIYAGDTKMRLYNDSYANAKEATIKLNSKEHRLVAQHGDSLGCGFNKPYYLADKTFNVVKGVNTVEAVAKLANVKIAVKYDATITENHSDYKVVIRHNTFENKTLTFGKDETRYGYMPGGELTMEIWALIDGKWKVYTTVPGTYAPNDFVTFSITTSVTEGTMTVNIIVDSSVEDKKETIEIPAYTIPQDAPSITLAGFDGTGNTHEFIEGVVEGNNATATFIARGSLKKCVLTISSEYLKAKGIPSEVDFTALSSDVKAQLKAAGFSWEDNMTDSRTFSWIDFSGVIANMLRETRSAAEDVVMAGFGLKIVDGAGKETTSSFSIVSGSVKPTLEVHDYNVWARKIVSPVVTINKGNTSLVKLQYSPDQGNWYDLNVTPAQNAYTLTYDVVPVEPATTYYIRSIYNGNTACVSPVKTVVTETEAQLGNSGFEDWTSQVFTTNYDDVTWYQPWTTDQWWDTNTTASLRSSLTVGYLYYKSFGCVHWTSKAHSGSRAAQITCVNVGNSNSEWATTGTWYNGELFIGRGNQASNGDSWSHTTDGHSFSSRPVSMTFWYQYEPYQSGGTFAVEIIVKASDGTVLSSSTSTASASSSWTQKTLPLTYSVTNKKADSIYISFKAESDSDHACETGFTMNGPYLDIAGQTKTDDNHQIKLSATLRVDDVTLNY